MKVSACIASRGRPELLKRCVSVMTEGARLDSTVLSVALDLDDTASAGFAPDNPRVFVSFADREDSLGAKYNRAQRNVPADIYVLWADDMVIPEPGWDVKLSEAAGRLPAQTGAILFGKLPNVFQPGLALTHAFTEAQGFFCQPYTPTWWHETWSIEVASMSGCYTRADIDVALLDGLKGNSTGELEIAWWAEFFDATRSFRRSVAENILLSVWPADVQDALRTCIPTIMDQWAHSNAVCRDPQRAHDLASYYGLKDVPPFSERYVRLKEKAARMLRGEGQ